MLATTVVTGVMSLIAHPEDPHNETPMTGSNLGSLYLILDGSKVWFLMILIILFNPKLL